MGAADSAQRSDVPQQVTNVLKPAALVPNAAAFGSAPSVNMDDAGESEAKKLRVDEDKTSTYDLSEEDVDCEDHNHSECKSVRQPKCANCGGNLAASYYGCPQNIAASKLRRHELMYGRLPPHNAPSPNPPCERHDQSTGNAAHCAQASRESGRVAQEQPLPLSQQPHLTYLSDVSIRSSDTSHLSDHLKQPFNNLLLPRLELQRRQVITRPYPWLSVVCTTQSHKSESARADHIYCSHSSTTASRCQQAQHRDHSLSQLLVRDPSFGSAGHFTLDQEPFGHSRNGTDPRLISRLARPRHAGCPQGHVSLVPPGL
ncbi:hypothetical protein HPB50_021095 [Hyalomma asiaticum]|uniref:Uncharacterized protein n=1 Tax=Hyalomma asiaticum TaxID=266040 RepID=A0ACB7TQU8_HYAAI|nr:hypothetical protein HPB50_021095 [Hyalomma asiaticum]